MDDAPAVRSSRELPTTVIVAIAAVAMTLVAIFGHGERFTPLTVTASLAGLVPWALLVGGVRVPPLLFACIAIVVGFLVVVVDKNPGGVFPLLMVIVFVTKSTGNAWLVGGLVFATAAEIIGVAIRDGSVQDTGMVYFLGGLGITWLSGRMLRRQELLHAELQAMHELRIEHAAAAERTHIAREVHDIVAHSMTVMMLHLTGARRALATDPGRADEALARAEAVGRDSLDGVRQVIGLLRSEEQGGATATSRPLPGVAELAELIDSYSAGGLAISADIGLDARELDPATQLIVYRVVQESLSNVLQHAPGAPSRVRVASSNYDPEGSSEDRLLVVDVVNEAPTRPASVAGTADRRAGLGLRGMAERLRAYGGSFSAGPTDDGGWRVCATLAMGEPTDRKDSWMPTPTAS
ncbi:MAG: histidine kinase [Ilumatobacteraceae bacterium]|jgi:signal transduction histidine kinase